MVEAGFRQIIRPANIQCHLTISVVTYKPSEDCEENCII